MSITLDGTFTGKEKGGLVYPFDTLPPKGGVTEVVPGVYWVRMALPMLLDHINLWLLRDGEGWSLVDTGLNTDETRVDWDSIFETCLDGKPITRVFVTHMHPDHMGLAGWITEKFDCPLWMSRTDFLMARNLISDTGERAPEVAVRFYRAAGFNSKQMDIFRQRFGRFGKGVSHMPDAYRRMRDGQVITIGDSEWQVVVGTGHSPEHACLYNPEYKLLLSGDQVLPRITSNVSLFPTEPEGDPLTDWIESCARLKRLLPADLLVLPAHNTPFYGLHERLQQLIDGHEENLAKLLDMLAEPKRAVDVFPALFKRKIDGETFFMASGESLAHLQCLISRGKARKRLDDNGVHWYERV